MKKAIICMALVVVMVVATCMPAFAAEPEETATGMVHTSEVVPYVTYYYVNGNSVNVRSGPSTSYSVVGVVNKMTVVRFLGSEYNKNDGYTWYNVYVEDSHGFDLYAGWIRSDLLTYLPIDTDSLVALI